MFAAAGGRESGCVNSGPKEVLLSLFSLLLLFSSMLVSKGKPVEGVEFDSDPRE